MTTRTRMIALLVLLLMGTTSLMALPDHWIEIYYYTDSTYSTECGYLFYTCGSRWYGEGCRTQYHVDYHYEDC